MRGVHKERDERTYVLGKHKVQATAPNYAVLPKMASNAHTYQKFKVESRSFKWRPLVHHLAGFEQVQPPTVYPRGPLPLPLFFRATRHFMRSCV